MASTTTNDEKAEAAKTSEFIEYTGDPGDQHGTAFLSSHTILKNDPVWERLRVDKPTKDLVWTRDEFGPAIGHKGNRMLLPTDGLDPALVQGLAKVPGFKVVNE